MTQPPPPEYPAPSAPRPAADASPRPEQTNPWGPQQPADWGQQPQPQWGQQPPQQQWGQPAGQWGQPQPGPWGQPPAPHPPQEQGTNGFAIASLICAILGGLLLSVVFGAIALSQIKRRGQKGKGLAVAGFAISGAWLATALVAGVVVAVVSAGNTDDPATSVAGKPTDVQQLKPGQCLNGLREGGSIVDLPVVSCVEPHEGEVFAVFDLPDGAYPGDAEVTKQAEEGCVERIETHAPKAAENPNLELYYLHPTRESWRWGDQGVACVAMSSTGKVTGSIHD